MLLKEDFIVCGKSSPCLLLLGILKDGAVFSHFKNIFGLVR